MIDGSKIHALADKLYALTKANKIEWKEDPYGSDAPWAKIGEDFIVLREGRNASGSELLKISLEDANDRPIYQFSDEDLDNGVGSIYFEKLTELFATARRQSSGVDKKIDDLLDRLDKLDT